MNEFSKLQAELTRIKQKLDNYQTQPTSKKDQNKFLYQKCILELLITKNLQEQQLKSQQNTIAKLEKEKKINASQHNLSKKIQKQLSVQYEVISEKQQKIAELQSIIKKLEEKNEQLDITWKSETMKYAEIQQEQQNTIMEKQAEIRKISQLLQCETINHQESIKQLACKESEISKLKLELTRSNNMNQQWSIKFEQMKIQLQTNLQNVQEELQNEVSKCLKQQSIIKTIEHEKNQNRSQVEQLSIANSQLQQQKFNLSRQITLLQEKIKQNQKILEVFNDLNRQHQELEKLDQKNHKLENEIFSMTKQLKTTKKQLSLLKDHERQLQEQLHQTQQKNKKIQKSLKALRKQYNEIKQQLELTQDKKMTNDDRVKRLEQQIKQQKVTIRELELEIDKKKQQFEQGIVKMRSLQLENSEIKIKMTKDENNMNYLSSRNRQLQQTLIIQANQHKKSIEFQVNNKQKVMMQNNKLLTLLQLKDVVIDQIIKICSDNSIGSQSSQKRLEQIAVRQPQLKKMLQKISSQNQWDKNQRISIIETYLSQK